LAAGMFAHGFHNTVAAILPSGLPGILIGTAIDWTGWFFMFIIIIWATWREQQNLKKYLTLEVQAGTVTPAQFRTAASGWLQMFARITAIFNGKYIKTVRFYQVCGEYAHKRRQFDLLGDETGNLARVQKLRTELIQLAPFAHV
jgi:hypothetical protein